MSSLPLIRLVTILWQHTAYLCLLEPAYLFPLFSSKHLQPYMLGLGLYLPWPFLICLAHAEACLGPSLLLLQNLLRLQTVLEYRWQCRQFLQPTATPSTLQI